MTTNAAQQTNATTQIRKLVELSNYEARRFFLTHDRYSTLPVPPYFSAEKLIRSLSNRLLQRPLSKKLLSAARGHEGVNHVIHTNTDGKYSWRPIEFIHPVLYADLVNQITRDDFWNLIISRLKQFEQIPGIRCQSLPESDPQRKNAEVQIAKWWEGVEQASVAYSLDYAYLYRTDISSCYPSIYTHSVAWALHGKDVAKKNRGDSSLVGNVIDARLQNMRHGQTNGIPQGSVLMDFIAELVLGYADLMLTEKLTEADITDYNILRYRDDYRIFVNSPEIGESILKHLTEVMIDFGLSLNVRKTEFSDDVIRDSIKEDKLAWMSQSGRHLSIRELLLVIHKHAQQYPHSGSIEKALVRLHRRLSRTKIESLGDVTPLISIATDICFNNPRVIQVYSALLSRLLVGIDDVGEKLEIVQKIVNRFAKIPNTGNLDIWLQRICKDLPDPPSFEEPLCGIVTKDRKSVWEDAWVSDKTIVGILESISIFDEGEFERTPAVIPPEEIGLFLSGY